MATDFNPTLKRVLRELQALRARIDQQIMVLRRVIQATASLKTGTQKKAKRTSRPTSVGYAQDRRILLKRKAIRRPR